MVMIVDGLDKGNAGGKECMHGLSIIFFIDYGSLLDMQRQEMTLTHSCGRLSFSFVIKGHGMA